LINKESVFLLKWFYTNAGGYMKQLLLILPFTMMLWVSCSVNSTLTLDSDNSGNWESHIELKPFFEEFFFDIFDKAPLIEEIERGFQEHPGISAVLVENQDNLFVNSFRFNDLNQLPGLSEGVMELSSDGNLKTLTIKLNRENWSNLEAMIPLLSDPSISYMGPQGSQGLSRDEFGEMLLYPFDGYAPSNHAAQEALDQSIVYFIIEVKGRIISQKGGEILTEQRVQFTIPLFELLMLDRELYYELSYQ